MELSRTNPRRVDFGAAARVVNEAEDPYLLWKYDAEDPAVSDPTPGPDGELLLSSNDADDRFTRGAIHSISPEGKRNWKFDSRGLIGGAPVPWEDRVYAGSNRGELFALDRANGKVIWQTPPAETEKGHYRVTPTVDGDGNLYSCRTRFEYFERGVATPVVELLKVDKDGQESWKNEYVGGIAVDRARAVIGPEDSLLYAAEKSLIFLDQETGRERWRFELGGKGGEPVLFEDKILIASIGSDERHLVRALNHEGELIWTFENKEPLGYHIPSLALDEQDGVLFVGDWGKAVFAVDAETGEEKWSKEPGGYGAFIPEVGPEGTVYFAGGRTNKFHVYDAETGESKWSFLSDGRLARAPLHLDESVIVAGKGGVVALAEDALERRIAALKPVDDEIEIEAEENVLIVGDFRLEIEP